MAESIRGINVVIGSDTTGLSKALKDVNKNARDIASELRQVERLLKFNPKDTTLLAQKQKLLADQVENTKEKLNRLKAAQEQVNEQFKKGEISQGQYRAFERELIKTESQLKHFESQLKSSTSASEQFAKKMQEVGSRLKSAGEKMSSVGKSLSTKLTAPILGVGAALATVATKSAQTTDRIDKMSQKLGISRKAFQELDFVLSQNGASIDSLQAGMKTLSDAAYEASKGTKSYAEAFDTLGISVTDTNGNLKSQEELLYETITALQGMEDKTKRTAIASDLFGRSATELAPLLNAGAGSMEELTKKAHELGLILSDESIEAGAEFTDTLDQIKRSLGAAATEVGVALMPAFKSLVPVIQDNIVPAVKSLAEKVGNLVEWFSNLNPTAQKIIIAAIGLAAALGPVLMVLGPIVTAVGTLTPMLGALGAAIAGISAPAVGTVVAIAGLAAIAIEVYRNWEEVKNALINIWNLIKASAVQLGLNIAITFEEMKATVLNTIDAMLEKLGVLEKLPFGIGDKFKGLKDNIADSADKSAEKIEALKKSAQENGKKVAAAVQNTKVAFSDMGNAVKKNIQGVVGAIKGQTKTIKKEQEKQTEIIEKEQKKQTDIIQQNALEQLAINRAKEDEFISILERGTKEYTDISSQRYQKAYEQYLEYANKKLAKARALGKDMVLEEEKTSDELEKVKNNRYQAMAEKAKQNTLTQLALARVKAQELAKVLEEENILIDEKIQARYAQWNQYFQNKEQQRQQDYYKQIENSKKLLADQESYVYQEITLTNEQTQAMKEALIARGKAMQEYFENLTLKGKLSNLFKEIGFSTEEIEYKFNELRDSLVEGLTAAITKGENFLDTLKSIADQIASMVVQRGLVEPFVNWALAGIGFAHEGAYVSPAGLIRDMPRYHSGGLASDEVPAVLQTGERVLSREQNKAFERGEFGKTEIHNHVTINAVDAASFAQLVRRNPDAITSVIAEDYRRNGLTRKIIKGGK